MALVFYSAPWSPSVSVHWALDELGIAYEIVEIDLDEGDQNKPGYRLLNPNGKVPVIVHDGTVIFESAAIILHLGETFGVERGLFPAPGIERAKAFQWTIWANTTLGVALQRFRVSPTEEARSEVEEALAVLDAELADRRYLVGSAFTLVDVHVATFASWAALIGFDLRHTRHVGAWLRRCTTRPTFGVPLAA